MEPLCVLTNVITFTWVRGSSPFNYSPLHCGPILGQAGGTGGTRPIPALAIANSTSRKTFTTPECLFQSETARGYRRNRLVPAAGFPLQLVRVGAPEKCQA